MTKDEIGGGIFFDTHPLYAQKADESYANLKEKRPKVMCRLCQTQWIIDEQHRDRDAQQKGQINEVRIQEQILASMWAYEKGKGHYESCPWLHGRPETMCTHIKNCHRQPQEVREQTYEICVSRNWIKGHGAAVPLASRSASLPTQVVSHGGGLGVPLPDVRIVPDLHYYGTQTLSSNMGTPLLLLCPLQTKSWSPLRVHLRCQRPVGQGSGSLPFHSTQSLFFSSHPLHSRSNTPLAVSNPPSASQSPVATSKYLDLLRTTTVPDDQTGLHAIVDSLEKRWSKSDQMGFIAAVILNPLYKAKPFSRIRQFTTAGITSLLCKLWQRFQSTPAPESLRKEILDYLQDQGNYEGFSEWAEDERNAAETQHERPDTLRMYEGIRFQDQPLSPLQMLAQRIFSICANSASCERLFSLFGLILTKLRSRLALEKMLDLAELRLHLRDEYMRRGSVKDRLRRSRHIIPDPLPPPQNKGTPASSGEITPESSEFDSGCDETSLTSIAEALGRRSELDDAEDPTSTFTTLFQQIPLQHLFNFSDDTWAKLTERIGMRSLDDELEFYELVELDAEGEADDQTFDDMMCSTVS